MKQTSKVFLWHSCRTVIAQWTTRDWGHPIVQWGTEPGGPLERQTNGSFTTYTKLQMCGAPANGSGWVDPGYLNFAAMTGLLPSTRYFYSVGDPVCCTVLPSALMKPSDALYVAGMWSQTHLGGGEQQFLAVPAGVGHEQGVQLCQRPQGGHPVGRKVPSGR